MTRLTPDQHAMINARWKQHWRASLIKTLMRLGLSYAEAVKWSRRLAKRGGYWEAV